MAGESLSARMARLARGLRSEKTSAATLEHIVKAAVDLIEPCSSAGISVRRGGPSGDAADEIHTIASTDERAPRSDQLQLELGEGPCVAATWEGDIVVVSDLVTDERWPGWGRQVAEELEVRSMLCLRLFTDEGRFGVLNLFGAEPSAMDAALVREEALAIAAHAAVALAAIEQVEDVSVGPPPGQTIAQATGILMARHSLTDMAAFDLLVRLAGEERIRVLGVAERIVAEYNRR